MSPEALADLAARVTPSFGGRIAFAGLTFDPVTVEQVLAVLAGRDPGAPFAYLTTPNAEHVHWARHSPGFAEVSRRALLSTCDSRVLRRIAAMGGVELPLAPGAYVVQRLFDDGIIRRDDPLTLLGGTPDVVRLLTERYGLTRLAQHVPPMGFIRDPAAVEAAVRFTMDHPARFVFIAMGPPHSDILAMRIMDAGGASGVGLAIGGSLATLVGITPWAPAWMERNGLVWLYRLAREPKRLWRRYLVRALAGAAAAARDAASRRLVPGD